MIIAARFVVPVSSPPIENGAVQFEGGVITAVGRRSEISRKSGEELIDYGYAVILPGFINAHTHLELAHLAGQVPPTPDFPHWLSRLVRHFAEHPPTQESVTAAVREGIRQSLAAGVTAVGDITRFPEWTRPVLGASALQGVSFGEVIAIGTRRNALNERLSAGIGFGPTLRAKDGHEPTPLPKGEQNPSPLSEERQNPSPLAKGGHRGVGLGLSPHSPYTVEPDALRICAVEADQRELPLCVHAAESREEVEFVRTGRGPMRNFLESIGVWDGRIPVPGCSPIELLDRVGLLTPRTILAHCNYVTDEDIALIAKSGASVVYCPRTHAAFGHPSHRFMDMLAAGINVCLGTDSLASNPTLSILEELRTLRAQHLAIDSHMLVHMATLAGAKALQLAPGSGALVPGQSGRAVMMQYEGTLAGILDCGGTPHFVAHNM